MNFSSNNHFQEVLGLMKQCPLCKKEYEEKGINSVEEKDNVKVVHITCTDCGNAVLAMIVSSDLGVSSVGVITDLTAKDSSKFLNKEPISEDDLLNFHDLLEKRQTLFIKSLINKL